MTEREADDEAKARNAALPDRRRELEYWVPVPENELGEWTVEHRRSKPPSLFRALWDEVWPFGSSIRP